MEGHPERILVLGAGIGGVSTVAALRRMGYQGELWLVDEGHQPYDRPPLSKDYLAGRRGRAEIALQAADWFDAQDVRLFRGVRAIGLRPEAGQVQLADGQVLTADRIVLATGGRARRLPIPGGDGEHVHVLRTAEDADRLRTDLGPGRRLLVIGAGLIGAEVASTALDLGCVVTVIDPLPVPLVAALGPELATWLHDEHTRRGIEVITGTVTSLAQDTAGTGVTAGTGGTGGTAGTPGAGTVLAALSGEAQPRPFDVVVLGVGMVADTELAQSAGLLVDGGVLVDERQVTSHPRVLAVGDVARTRADGIPQRATEHWEAAQRGADRAAATLLGSAAPTQGAPWFWTDRHHLHVECVGHMDEAETRVVRGSFGEGPAAVFGLAGGRLVAVAAVDDAMAIKAGRRLIDRKTLVDPSVLADPHTELRGLLRA